MKISEVTSEHILFDNGNTITFYHEPDCCEHNYADFEQLDDEALSFDYPESLMFESTDSGFMFGSDMRRFFVPCYSMQNGYYTNALDIYYNDKRIMTLNCDVIY